MTLFGKRYFIEHCLNYLKKDAEDKAYRIYTTDALKAIIDNALKREKAQISKRYAEIVGDNPKIEDPKETAEETIARIKKGLRKKGNKP